MTDNRTIELIRKLLEERGLSCQTHYLHAFWYVGPKLYEAKDNLDGTLTVGNLTPEQAIAATLGSERDAIYNAGFDNGIKTVLHQLNGLLVKTDSAVEIQAWVDEQWKEYES